ncbi:MULTISPECIES: SsgA family sporulation/cell division regulator [unclassified Streptomyces]|uniref:SsgA family sporulation/cell division regulator n=1 Tax=unclassified Streptomyces TaxID=2593676 RepID=UPI002DD9219A|nr:SsgA family sporulation/cell division regulator [Streptomyces sp. NBC_01750]WSA99445.1 SsgA family sporulation/cell division regulator [Streptomyces sp. NBC_01794]WSD35989.1 SsgA family sporulation/cell division regulator [Streptomyces sp. NBC_01750]
MLQRGRRPRDTAPTTVERELVCQLVLEAGRTVPVPTRLVYRTDDPYAVHVAFHTDTDTPVEWFFARDLLIEGVFHPTGQGDVKIWPGRTPRTMNFVYLLLSAPDEHALLQAPAAAVSAWTERTLRLVPPGSEESRLPSDVSTLPPPLPGGAV